MFARKKKNKSGSTSIQIIDKSQGHYRVLSTIGCSAVPEEIEQLAGQAHARMDALVDENQLRLFAPSWPTDELITRFLSTLGNDNIRTVGPELIFGKLFDRIGFDAIPEEMFRHLVLARLAYPVSKLKTVDYLYRYQGTVMTEDAVYKFLDRFVSRHKEKTEHIAFAHTQHIVKNISVVFYDMTTLYFEAEDEDDLRKIGFSKDGQFQKPQIMLGLLVAQQGYPIGYDIFEGNTFEGHTLLPVLEQMQKKYHLSKPVVIADAALLSKGNLQRLSENGYPFIIGARIKNESESIKTEILQKSCGMKDGESFALQAGSGYRLIVTYSVKRAQKDAYNREKGIQKLRQRIQTGKLTKEHINNRGYNKFLVLEGALRVFVDEKKINDDTKWDGLKGYLTSTDLPPKNVVENYQHLWHIEKAFRISKTDLRIRPIYHYKKQRIQAHICIAFVAYTIWKELERLLHLQQLEMSPKRAAELVQTMYALEYEMPQTRRKEVKILNMSSDQQALYKGVQ